MNSKYEFSQDAIDNFMFIHAYWKNSCDGINAAPENKWGYKRGDIPFIDYLCEDKSKYLKASEGISYITNKPLYDPDNDFLIGNSGGILMNIDFIVINIERLSKLLILLMNMVRIVIMTLVLRLMNHFGKEKHLVVRKVFLLKLNFIIKIFLSSLMLILLMKNVKVYFNLYV